MKFGGRLSISLFAILLGAFGGWALVRTAVPAPPEKPDPSQAAAPRQPVLPDTTPRSTKTGERTPSGLRADAEAEDAGALSNQRTIRFADRDALERFLKAIEGRGISVLGSIDRLNTLRVGFLSLDELRSLLEGDEEMGMIFPISLPNPVSGGVQAGAVGFGPHLLAWLGITGDNSQAGSGVRIAILDSGVAPTSSLGAIPNTFFTELPSDPGEWNGHGTMMADIIRQIAPQAELLSFAVAGVDGTGDTFALAQAFLAALDAGVDLVNVSLTYYGRSSVVDDALAQLAAAGIKINVSSGNDNYDSVGNPAASPYANAIGAIDANGMHLDFSNSGDIAMATPGLDLVVNSIGDQRSYVSGTSPAAAVATGLDALVMSPGNGVTRTAAQASELISGNLNDTGAPGYDAESGGGYPNAGRILNAGTPGIHDAAVTYNYVTDLNGQTVAQVVIQNQGTETLVNPTIDVQLSNGTSSQRTVATLAPGAIEYLTIPLPSGSQDTTIQSSVILSGGAADANPSNNRRTDVYTPTDAH